jgi:hypothetical protein
MGLQQKNGTSLRDIIRPGESRGLDFVKIEELNRRTGIIAYDVVPFTVSELLPNALDKKDATQINIDVQRDREFDYVTVSDNGSKKLEESDLKLILDFENKASSKRGWLQVSRGMLGNALKSIFGYSFACTEARGLKQPPITVESGQFRYQIRLKPDRVLQKIGHEIQKTERVNDGFTTVSVSLPIERTVDDLKATLKNRILGTSLVNPQRLISYNLYREQGTLGTAQEIEVKELETIISWYTLRQHMEQIEDCVRGDPKAQAKNYIGVFKWFSRKSAIRDILYELNARNVHSQNEAHVQFVPTTPLKDFSSQDSKTLLEIMKTKSKPINKRSAPNLLGYVGKDSFERIRQQYGWPKLRYIRLCGMKRSCPEQFHFEPCKNLDHVEFPYLVELAIFDRKDSEGLKVYEAVNFMASSHDILRSMFDLQYRLGRVGIVESSSVTIIVHVVSPILPWTNYGKTSLGNIDSCGLLEQAFNKLLPIPKTPRVYHPPPPPRPLSWVPHGNLHDLEYEQRLRLFASEIKAIDKQSSFHIRPRMRGWGYRLEQLGKIDKGEFNAVAKAINDCRKMGEKHGGLPMDIISPDPDSSRHFKGIHRAVNPKAVLEEVRNDIKEMLASLPSNITDFYNDEKYYLIMAVEKGEVLLVFGPICKEYYIPNVSFKGWSNLEIRANIAAQCKWAMEHYLIPVLLLFFDHDPKGLKIPERARKHLKDMERATGWDPDNKETPMIIERFGLNKSQIDKFKLAWVPNLKTSSGKEAKRTRDVREYIRQFGERKCEMESLFKDDDTVRNAEQICREAIERYYGKDAKERFRKKEEESKAKLGPVYDSPVWQQLNDELTRIEQTLSEQEPKTEPTSRVAEDETEVCIDKEYYGKCPKCGTQFNYDETDVGKLVRCRNCNIAMRLKLAEK